MAKIVLLVILILIFLLLSEQQGWVYLFPIVDRGGETVDVSRKEISSAGFMGLLIYHYFWENLPMI